MEKAGHHETAVASITVGLFCFQQTFLLNSNLFVMNFVVIVVNDMVKEVSDYDTVETTVRKSAAILKKYQKIKAGLGPLLFILVTCITVNFLLSTYYAFRVINIFFP